MFLLLVSVALVVAANASPMIRDRPMFPNGRIVGGEDAQIETYPYQVSLEFYTKHYCGGSIIAKNYVLTAGHCAGYSTTGMTVRAGTSKKEQGGSVHHVAKIIIHEDYHMSLLGTPINDIAIIVVKEPFNFDDTRLPINLYDSQEVCDAGVRSVITGWGNTGKGLPVQLQTVVIPIVAKKQCSDSYGAIPDGQICAAYYGVGGKDSCQGDSGGPLVINGRLAGVVSWGNGCAEAYYPGVYTEVAHYREWVDKHIQH